MTPQTGNSFQSWLFTSGHDIPSVARLLASRPAVLVVDLEEFTPSDRKDEACMNFNRIVSAAEGAGVRCAIRLDPLGKGGDRQLAAIAAARPCAILLPQIEQPQQLRDLWRQMIFLGLEDTALVPTIESRTGLSNLNEILTCAPRITAALLGTGDLSTDLGLGQDQERMTVLQSSREGFASLCRHHDVDPIDGPWPELADPLQRPDDYFHDCKFSRDVGFRSRCALTAGQVISWQS